MKTLVSLQVMRAVAAILVVIFHHVNALRDGLAPSLPGFDIGRFGVDLFFVISGFIMWVSVNDATRPGDFMRRRFVRIAPLYWAMTLITAFVTTTGGLAVTFNADFPRLVKSLLFIPQKHAVYDMIAPYMIVGWTLELEMLFYALFAGGLLLSKRKRFAAVSAALLLLALVGFLAAPTQPILRGFTNDIIIEFIFGMALGAAYEQGRAPRSPAAGAGLVALGAALLIVQGSFDAPRFLHFGVPALAIVAGALAFEGRMGGRIWTPPKFLGDASYSIYLSHMMAMAVSARLVSSFAEAAPLPALIVQLAFALGFGALVYLLMERPLTDAARGLLRPPRSPAVVGKT